MADMLKFRKGTLAQINGAAKVPGTIYIAKDEKAMYVDIDTTENGRIRIGDFVRVATVSDIPFPASTTALYYVEADNALLGYDGENWKQINSTEALNTRLTTAENDINAVEGLVGTKADAATVDTAFGRIAKNKADISTLNTYVGTIPATAEATNIVAYIQEKTAGIATDTALEELTNRVTQAEDDIDALEGTVSGHTNSISTINTTLGNKADTSYVDDTFVTKTKANPILAKVDTTKKVSEAIADAVAAEAAIARAAEQANASGVSEAKAAAKTADDKAVAAQEAADAAATAASNANTNAESRVKQTDFEAFQITNSAAIKSADDKAVAAQEAATAANANANNRVLKSDFETFQESNTDAIADAKKAGTDAANAFNAYSEAHKDDYDNSTIDTKVKAASDAAATAQARADSAYNLANAAVTDDDLADAIKDFATTGQVATAKQEAIDAAAAAGDLAYAPISLVQTVAANTSAIGVPAENGVAATGLYKKIDDHAATAEQTYAKKTDVYTKSEVYTKTQVDAAIDADVLVETNRAKAAEKANADEISSVKSTVTTLNGDINTAGSVKKQIKDASDALQTSLESKIIEEINAANAMDYQRGVGSQTDFDGIVNAKAGDTYVVTAKFGNYYPGDLLIATGDEDPTTGLITNLSWTHVKTGYDASLEQKLETVDGKIQLSSITGANNGTIEFKANPDSSASVSLIKDTSNSSNSIVTIGMVWEDFDE